MCYLQIKSSRPPSSTVFPCFKSDSVATWLRPLHAYRSYASRCLDRPFRRGCGNEAGSAVLGLRLLGGRWYPKQQRVLRVGLRDLRRRQRLRGAGRRRREQVRVLLKASNRTYLLVFPTTVSFPVPFSAALGCVWFAAASVPPVFRTRINHACFSIVVLRLNILARIIPQSPW